MDEAVDVPGAEDEAAAELERVPPEPMLAVTCRARPRPGRRVGTIEEMERGGHLETGGPIGAALLIDEQREADPGLVPERPRIRPITEPDRREPRTARPERLLVRAQLRDMLAAEDSAVVSKKYDYGGSLLPQRAEANNALVYVRQGDVRKRRTQRTGHIYIFSNT